jgi:1,4-dihydroxy-2-naphthoate polyprenyltransferase
MGVFAVYFWGYDATGEVFSMETITSTRPSLFQIWILASRPRTLPAAAAPVIVGTAVAFSDGRFAWGPALAALLGALLLQIGANFANDVFDYQKGADTSDRLGPVRVTSAGLLTPRQVKTGMWAAFGLAAVCGVYLAVHAGWPVIVIGLCSILAAIAYTAGPYPLGYHGLGELAVFLFFGLAAVCGTYYVQARQFNLAAVASALPMGLLAVAILIVNNLRDLETDRASGKRTLVTRFGADWARREYLWVIGLAYLIPWVMWLTGGSSAWVLSTWVTFPLVLSLRKSIYTLTGRPLNKILGQTGQLELLYGLAFSAGFILQVVLSRH